MKTAFYKVVSLVFLIASSGVLAGVFQFEHRSIAVLTAQKIVAWKPETTVSAHQNSNELVIGATVSDLTASLTRPLMSQSRRPFDAPVAVMPEPVVQALAPEPAPPPVATLEGYRLMGVFDDGSVEKALIATPSLPLGSWVKTSDVIEGFVVKNITGDVVTLEQQGQQLKLQQYVDKRN